MCACSSATAEPASSKGGGHAAPATPSSTDQAPGYAAAFLDLNRDRAVYIPCVGGGTTASLRGALAHIGMTTTDPVQAGRLAAVVTVIGEGTPPLEYV